MTLKTMGNKGKHDKQIGAIIKQYFENSQNIEVITRSPDPKRSLYELTNKLSTKFCLENGILSTDSASPEMLSSFGNKVEELSKRLYIADGFNFKTELSASLVVKTIETLTKVDNTAIPATSISVNRATAAEFLPSYEKRISELEKEKAKYEQLLTKKVSEKVRENFLNKLEETEKELGNVTDTVKEVTSGEKQFIMIHIPVNPEDKFMDMPQRGMLRRLVTSIRNVKETLIY